MISVTTAILTRPTTQLDLASTAPLSPSHSEAMCSYPPTRIPRSRPVATSCAFVGVLATIMAVYRAWRITPRRTRGRSSLICGGVYVLASVWPSPGLVLGLKLMVIRPVGAAAFLVLGEFGRASWPYPAARFVVHPSSCQQRIGADMEH